MAKSRKTGTKKSNTKSDKKRQNAGNAAGYGRALQIKLPKTVETGVPELVDMYCSHCGGTLEVVDSTRAKCPFCGATFLIDEPEDLNVNIYLPENLGVFKKLKELPVFLAAFFLHFCWYIIGGVLALAVAAAVTGCVKHFQKQDIDPAIKQFYEETLGDSYKKLTNADFNRIKYFDVVWGEPAPGEFTLYYSFADRAGCESDEEFAETLLKWDEVTKDFDPYPIYDRLHGLTYVVITDENKNFIPADAPITCVEAGDVSMVNEKVCGNDVGRKEQVERLWLKYYSTEDIAELAQFTGLRELSLDQPVFEPKSVMDVSALSACAKLEKLSLDSAGSQPFIGLGKFAALKDLRELYLPMATLDQCSFLAELNKLERLTLKAGEKHDVSSLRNLSGLKYLYLSNEYINLSELPDLPDLEELICKVHGQWEFDQVTRFSGLKRCSLQTEISMLETLDVSALGELEHLEYLSLYSFHAPPITHLESVLELQELQELHISSSMGMPQKLYVDAGKLTGKSALKSLYMPHCYLYDQSTLEQSYEMFRYLRALESLVMRECRLEDLSFLSGLPNLRELNVEKNNIYDYSPLADCPKLETLYLGDNPIVDPGLPERVEFIPYDTKRLW